MEFYIFLSALTLIVLYIIFTYNNLIKNKNLVKEGWSGIEVHLKQRADLIPNLISTVKGYTAHESQVLEKVTSLRTECLSIKEPSARADKENMLTQALKQIFAVAENYPDLKASQNFIELQKSLQDIEQQIQSARRYYNATVRDYNILIESFPSNLIAKQFQFNQSSYFELNNEDDRNVPEVTFK